MMSIWLRNANKETPKYSQQTMKEAIIYYNKSKEFEKALVLAKEYVDLYPEDLEDGYMRICLYGYG